MIKNSKISLYLKDYLYMTEEQKVFLIDNIWEWKEDEVINFLEKFKNQQKNIINVQKLISISFYSAFIVFLQNIVKNELFEKEKNQASDELDLLFN